MGQVSRDGSAGMGQVSGDGSVGQQGWVSRSAGMGQ